MCDVGCDGVYCGVVYDCGHVVIEPERFIARSSDREAWLEARSRGVTATMVSRAATPAGFREVTDLIREPVEVVSNALMDWGREREPYLAAYVHEEFGVAPNDWLISRDAGTSSWMMATPDGLSDDHTLIGEYKTSGKPLDTIPIHYRRQIQWQLFVTGAESCLFAYELRLDGPGGFVPGFDVVTQWVDRDEKMIADLIEIAQRVQMVNVYESWIEEE